MYTDIGVSKKFSLSVPRVFLRDLHESYKEKNGEFCKSTFDFYVAENL